MSRSGALLRWRSNQARSLLFYSGKKVNFQSLHCSMHQQLSCTTSLATPKVLLGCYYQGAVTGRKGKL